MKIVDIHVFIVAANREFEGGGGCVLVILENDFCSVFNHPQYYVDHFDVIKRNHGFISFSVICLAVVVFFLSFLLQISSGNMFVLPCCARECHCLWSRLPSLLELYPSFLCWWVMPSLSKFTCYKAYLLTMLLY